MKEPVWLNAEDATAIHAEQIAEHGGSHGIRDVGLLESAVNRSRNLDAYGNASIHDLAAAYALGIARNHPFVDGNKRTALVVSFTFLEINGREITASEEQAVMTFLELAAAKLPEEALAKWLRTNSARAKKPASRQRKKP